MKKIVISLFVLVIMSCGYKEGVIQKAEKSYLKFAGNWQGAVVEIDNGQAFKLGDYTYTTSDGRPEMQSPENKVYQIAPGKHEVKVYKKGNTVVNRILFLENQTTMEVFVP